MDGGAEEKQILDDIRKLVKLTTDSQRRQRALRAVRTSKEKQPQVGSTSTLREERAPLSPSRIHPTETRSLDSIRWLEDSSPDSVSRNHVGKAPALPRSLDPQIEPFLLMHYLDVVFPDQFPFYSPSISDGGRGWMLCLLMQSKPLYNAALCLAAFHQNVVLPPDAGKLQPSTYNEQDHFYTMALRGLRKHIDALNNKGLREGLKDSIEIFACVSQLIMFEVSNLIDGCWIMLITAPSR